MLKVVRIGTTEGIGSTYAKIEFKDGRLSITGVEGPKANGDARGSCGQIIMGGISVDEYAPGWNADKLEKFCAIWNAYHLNDMQAGSPRQTEFVKALPKGQRGYVEALEALQAAGLSPDPAYIHNGKPYAYGSAWLRAEVPADVIEWLQALPDADMRPAWV